jgi:LacI family transcriptional regulator
MTALTLAVTSAITTFPVMLFGRVPLAVTMRDVAEEAGVSIKTVSRVVNNQGEITDETRQRVLEAIERLGYRPSKVARALVTQRTDTIGLLVGDIANPYFSEVARGVMDAVQAQEFDVFIYNTDDVLEKRALYSLVDHNVDGAIVYPTYENLAWLSDFSNPDMPMVLVNVSLEPHPGLGIVCSRIEDGAILATSYLIEQGHQTIGMIAGEVAPFDSIKRVMGYRKALEEHGYAFREDMVILGEPQIQHGFDATKILLERFPQITAIVCYNDLLAMGALQRCKELGVRVPEECAIIGYDNISFAALVEPSLTTIHVDKYKIGEQAAKLLLDMLKEPQRVFPPIFVDTELIVRESA